MLRVLLLSPTWPDQKSRTLRSTQLSWWPEDYQGSAHDLIVDIDAPLGKEQKTMLPNHDNESIIKVLWLSGEQCRAVSGGLYQFIAAVFGFDITRYIDWLKNQPNSKDHWIVVSPGIKDSAYPENLLICFFYHSDPNLFKETKTLGLLFKTTWQDKYWKNGLEAAL